MIGDNWDPKESIRPLKYFLEDDAKNKARLHQLGFIEIFIQANVTHIFFVNLDNGYG